MPIESRGRSKPEVPFTWGGKDLTNLGDIRTEMLDIVGRRDEKEAGEFMASFRRSYGNDADASVFLLSGHSDSREEMVEMLDMFFQSDFSGEFFITEAPQDEYGNTAHVPVSISKVKIAEGYRGKPHLEVLEPLDVARKYRTFAPTAWRYIVVDGPARMMSREEWVDLVDFKAPGVGA